MADDVDARVLDIHPAVPHHLMGEEAVFRDAQRVCDTAAAVVLHAAEVGVGVGEYDLDPAGTDSLPGACPFPPVVIPAAHELHGELVLVVVVRGGVSCHHLVGHSGVEAFVALALLVERI